MRGAVTRRREEAGSTKKEKKKNTGCFNFATDGGGVGGAIAAGSTWTIAGQAVADGDDVQNLFLGGGGSGRGAGDGACNG